MIPFHKQAIISNLLIIGLLCWFVKKHGVRLTPMFNLNMVILLASFNMFLWEIHKGVYRKGT